MATPLRTAFQLIGADGGPLRVDVRRQSRAAGAPAVIICHGFKGFKDWGFFPVLADRLARAGLAAVSFNFSGSGVGGTGDAFDEPERFGHGTFSGDLEDIRTVRQALVSGQLGPMPPRIGVFGHSRGGGMAVLHASRDPVDRLVTWNAVAGVDRWGAETLRTWRAQGELAVENQRTRQVLPLYTDVLDDIEQHATRLDIIAAAAQVSVPWLIVHGTDDLAVPVADGRELAAASRGAAELREIAGGSHTFGARHPWSGSTAELDQALDVTVAWFTGLFD